jgi:phosphotransferase system enzyme I (PtsI)
MSFTMHGLGVSGGIAIGHAHLVTLASLEVDHYSIPVRIAKEIKRFDRAVKLVRAELRRARSWSKNGPQTGHPLWRYSLRS